MEETVHREVILVNDKNLAAALYVLGHESVGLFEHLDNNHFCALFKITKRLREDIKSYYGTGLAVNIKMINEEVDDINRELGDYLSFLEHRLNQNEGQSLKVVKNVTSP
jgi:hypothetical protein